MSQTHTKPKSQPLKKQTDSLESAMHEADAHALQQQHPAQPVDAVPPAGRGAHSHSAAAHLDLGGSEHTKPEGNLRQGSHPGALREPPMVIQRVGKQHRD